MKRVLKFMLNVQIEMQKYNMDFHLFLTFTHKFNILFLIHINKRMVNHFFNYSINWLPNCTCIWPSANKNNRYRALRNRNALKKKKKLNLTLKLHQHWLSGAKMPQKAQPNRNPVRFASMIIFLISVTQ